ncbi:hypothetical protein AB6A40_007171 [Gnathostoma spinigerum]|uniref:HMG box domain-containing protein n=1 Tax=Gnathostoma spinigerum TaxID=75299 RepID=A0ABD6EUU8_9BILA
MLHTPLLSYTDTSIDFTVYGIGPSEYIDINSIEPSLFPGSTCSFMDDDTFGWNIPSNCTPPSVHSATPYSPHEPTDASNTSNNKNNNNNSNSMAINGNNNNNNNNNNNINSNTNNSTPNTNKRKTSGNGKAVKKRKTKKDPNEPQKPVSAYALFFRDTQASIKGRSPNASFGEVSKIVASMWDALDCEAKKSYKQRTEVAKRSYLKQLAAYKANQINQDSQSSSTVPNEKNHTFAQHVDYHLDPCGMPNEDVGSMTLASLIALPPMKREPIPPTYSTFGKSDFDRKTLHEYTDTSLPTNFPFCLHFSVEIKRRKRRVVVDRFSITSHL